MDNISNSLPQIGVIKMENDVLDPIKKTKGSSGFDVHLYSPERQAIRLMPGETQVFRTGLKFDIPEGFEIEVRSRSGLSANGLIVANAPGTIDSDYQGECMIILHNQSAGEKLVQHGDRIAQLVVQKTTPCELIPQKGFKEKTERNESGLGSTGITSVSEKKAIEDLADEILEVPFELAKQFPSEITEEKNTTALKKKKKAE